VDATNHVQRVPVVLGIAGSNLQEVTSGIQSGTRVIVGGISTLQSGEKVTPQLAPNGLVQYQSADQKGVK
jgi:hypothetical protein